MAKHINPERLALARATKPELARPEATDDSGRGCWYPEPVEVDGFKRLAFKGFATGKGVAIGIIDSGMDPFHPSLFHISKDSAGKIVFTSRIAAIWDQFQNPAASQTALRASAQKIFKELKIDKPYGTILMRSDINKMLKDEYDPGSTSGKNKTHELFDYDLHHGTTCALLAAGHGSALKPEAHIGIAPEADIIFVRFVGGCYKDEMRLWDKPDDWPSDPEADAMEFCALIAKKYLSGRDRPLVISKSFGNVLAAPYRINAFSKRHDDFLKDRKNCAVVTATGNQGYRKSFRTFESRTRSPSSAPGQDREMQSLPLELHDKRSKASMEECGKYLPVTGHMVFHVLKRDSAALGDHGFALYSEAEQPDSATPKARMLEFRTVDSSGNLSSGPRLTPFFVRVEGEYRTLHRLLVPGYDKIPLYAFMSVKSTELFPGSDDKLFSVHLEIKPATGKAFDTQFKQLKNPFKLRFVFRTPEKEHITCKTMGNYSWKEKEKSGLFIGEAPQYVTWNMSGPDAPVFSDWGGPALPTKDRHQIAGRSALSNLLSVGAHDRDSPDAVSWYSQKGPIFEYDPAKAEPTIVKPNVVAQGNMETFDRPKTYVWNKEKTAIALPTSSHGWGTSYAGPIAAGIAALMLEKTKTPLTPEAITAAIEAAAVAGVERFPFDANPTNGALADFHAESGWGPVRAFDSVKRVM